MNTRPDTDTDLPSFNNLSFLTPERAAARTIQQIEWNEGENRTVNRNDIAELLEIECKAVADGDHTMVRRTLAAQIRVLERLYDHLLDRAMGTGPVMAMYDRYLKLAFRAQSQLTRTIALLERFSRYDKVEPRTKEPAVARAASVRPSVDGLVPQAVDEVATLERVDTTVAMHEERSVPVGAESSGDLPFEMLSAS